MSEILVIIICFIIGYLIANIIFYFIRKPEQYKNKIRSNVEDYCKIHYQKINKNDMKLGTSYFNRRCHLNAVQKVKEGQMKEVYACVYFNNNTYPIVHFINKDEEGFFVDNTLGWHYEIYDYYLISKIDESDHDYITNMLGTLKRGLVTNCSNSFLNKLFRIDENDIV